MNTSRSAVPVSKAWPHIAMMWTLPEDCREQRPSCLIMQLEGHSCCRVAVSLF